MPLPFPRPETPGDMVGRKALGGAEVRLLWGWMSSHMGLNGSFVSYDGVVVPWELHIVGGHQTRLSLDIAMYLGIMFRSENGLSPAISRNEPACSARRRMRRCNVLPWEILERGRWGEGISPEG